MGLLSQMKQKNELQKRRPPSTAKTTPARYIAPALQTKTMPKIAMPPRPPKPTMAQKESLLKGGENVLAEPLPPGYTAIGRHSVEQLMALKEEVYKRKLFSFDYETDGDPDEDTDDPQDHEIVGVSFTYQVGRAIYLPIAHTQYGANWDMTWLVENFLKPILEDPEIYIIAHNVKAEHQWSLLYGIDMLPKTKNCKVMDTLLLVKATAVPESIGPMGEVMVGLKPSAKNILADKATGMIHGLIHKDDVQDFGTTVGRHEWEEPTGEFYKSGPKKGKPKMAKHSKARTFGELPIDNHSVSYACSDSDWALALFELLMPIAESEGLLDVLYESDVPFMMVLGEIELSGWRVNRSKLEEMREVADKALNGDPNGKTEEERLGIEARLYEALIDITQDHATTDDEGQVIVPEGRYAMGSWRGEYVSLKIASSRPFNWGSTQHLQWLFFHVLGIKTAGIERSKTTGLPSTGADTIDKVVDTYTGDSKFMNVLKDKKKYDKILSTYVNGMLPYVRIDTDKLHTQLNLVSTWRLSSKKPNLQNIPRADNDPMGIRGVFEAPTYDPKADYSHLRSPFTGPLAIITKEKLSGETIYVTSDYSQIELKVLAWFANEQNMIQTFIDGGDLHSLVAKEVFHLDCPVDKVKELYKPFRYRSKKVNFGLVYGMTEHGLSKDPQMGMTKDEAKVFIDNYMRTYPGVKQYADTQISFAREHGYVETLFGHRRPIPEINHPKQFIRSKGENKAMNTPIQGSAADIIRVAMVNIQRESRTEAPYIRQIMQIHDEIITEVPVEYAAEAAKFLKSVMERPIEGFSEILPIVSEPAVGKIWQHALDIDWEANGQSYVTAKTFKKEATDVTIDEIQYALPLYEKAGIEVRIKDNRPKVG